MIHCCRRLSRNGHRAWPHPTIARRFPLLSQCHPLLRLARGYRFRSRAACNGGRRKDREIGIALDEPIETDLAIPNGCELAAQQTWWGTVLGCRSEGVDNADARFRLERGDEIVEQGVRLFDFVIHVHQNRNVDRSSWQLRIVRLTKAYYNVLQPENTHPLAQ